MMVTFPLVGFSFRRWKTRRNNNERSNGYIDFQQRAVCWKLAKKHRKWGGGAFIGK